MEPFGYMPNSGLVGRYGQSISSFKGASTLILVELHLSAVALYFISLLPVSVFHCLIPETQIVYSCKFIKWLYYRGSFSLIQNYLKGNFMCTSIYISISRATYFRTSDTLSLQCYLYEILLSNFKDRP